MHPFRFTVDDKQMTAMLVGSKAIEVASQAPSTVYGSLSRASHYGRHPKQSIPSRTYHQ